MKPNALGSHRGGISIKLVLFLAVVGYGIFLIEDQARAWWQWYQFRDNIQDILLFSNDVPNPNLVACVILAGKRNNLDVKPEQVNLKLRDVREGKLALVVSWDRVIDFKHKKVKKNYKLDIYEGLPMPGRTCKMILNIKDPEAEKTGAP